MNGKRLSIFFVSLAVFSISLSEHGSAAYKMGEDRPIKTSHETFPSSHERRENPEKTVMDELSKRYATPLDRLQYFRSLHHGYEEIVPALIVAREAQVEPGRILKLRMEGKTWKTIADSFFVELKPLNQEVLDVLTPIRKILPQQALIERPQTRN